MRPTARPLSLSPCLPEAEGSEERLPRQHLPRRDSLCVVSPKLPTKALNRSTCLLVQTLSTPIGASIGADSQLQLLLLLPPRLLAAARLSCRRNGPRSRLAAREEDRRSLGYLQSGRPPCPEAAGAACGALQGRSCHVLFCSREADREGQGSRAGQIVGIGAVRKF